MLAQDFAKFVESQQPGAEGSPDESAPDWAEIRDEWLRDLDVLYSQVLEFLKEFVEAGSVSAGKRCFLSLSGRCWLACEEESMR